MNEQQSHPEEHTDGTDPLETDSPIVRPLSTGSFLLYVLHGVGVTRGLCLLWVLEAVRNGYFRVLDRTGIKARSRKASAFPPGQPRKHPLTEASR
jgi:hypothetical protein